MDAPQYYATLSLPTIVMSVLYSHYRLVPKKVSLEMLAKIAVIVDYYKIHEAL